MKHTNSTLLVSLLSLFNCSMVNSLSGNKHTDWECVRNDNNKFYKLRKNKVGDTECATKNNINQCYFTKKLQACLKFKPKRKLTCSDKHKKLFKSYNKRGVAHWCQLTERVIQNEINNKFNKLISRGRNAKVNEFPFMIRLAMRKYHFSTEEQICGGSLIDSNWILTAAHCIYSKYDSTDKIPFYSITAIVGAHGWDDGYPFAVMLEDIHVHPNYDHYKIINDIALIQIPDEIKNYLQVPENDLIHINTKSSMPFGKQLQIAGWGLLHENDRSFKTQIPEVLQATNVTLINYNNCVRRLNKLRRSLENEKHTVVCAISKTRKDSCGGDSGGPLFKKVNDEWIIYGILSFGHSACGSSEPSVYTNLEHYSDWIKRKIRENDITFNPQNKKIG